MNKKIWFGIGGAAVLGVGLLTYNNVSKPSPDKAPVSSVSISTDHAVKLTFQISTATVDMCYKGAASQAKESNLLDQAFLSQTKSLGFDRAMIFSDGAITNVSHVAVTGGKGYNGKPTDFASDADYRAAMGGVLVANWKSDFLTSTLQFIHSWGVPCDVALNPNDTWENNKYRISQTGATYILLGSEEVSTEVPIAWTWQNYLSWAIATRDSINKYYTGKILIADQAQIWKNTRTQVQWRANINPTSLTGIWGADIYWQCDDQVHYTGNQDSNIIKTKMFFDSLVPHQIDTFKIQFPGWKIFAGEVLIKDADSKDPDVTNGINKNMAGVYTWGCFYKMFIENQDVQPVGVQMSMKSLNNPLDNNFKAIRLLNKTIDTTYSITAMTFSRMEGCDGYSLNKGDSHMMMIKNSSLTAYNLTSVKVNDKKKTPTFTLQRLYTTTGKWDGVVTSDSLQSTTLSIPAQSVGVYSFDTGK